MPIGFETSSRYGELLRRVFGSDEVTPPGILLELDRPEWAIWKYERVMSGTVVQLAGVVNTYSMIQLLNPSASGVLAVITHIELIGSAFTAILLPYLSRYDTALATLDVTARPHDTRWPDSIGRCELRHTTGAAELGMGFELMTPHHDAGAIQSATWDGALVLDPGHGIIVHTGQLQVDSHVSFRWRERSFLPEEERVR